MTDYTSLPADLPVPEDDRATVGLLGRKVPHLELSDTGGTAVRLDALGSAGELDLPTFETSGLTLYKRLTLVIRDGVVEHVFYPVFPPNEHADQVLAWLRGNSA